MLWIVLVLLLLGAVLWIAFQNSDLMKLAAAMERQADRVLAVAREAHDDAREPRAHLDRAVTNYVAAQRDDARSRFPLENLRPWIDGRVQWSALNSAGARTLADLSGVTEGQLQGIRGVGPATASRIMSAAHRANAEIDSQPIQLPGADLGEPEAPTTVAAALDVISTQAYLGDLPTRLEERHRAFAADRRAVSRRITFFGWVFKSGSGEAHSELMQDARAVEWAAREYLAGDEVAAFRDAQATLRRIRDENEVLSTLGGRFEEHRDEVLRVLRSALGDESVDARSSGAHRRAPAPRPTPQRPTPAPTRSPPPTTSLPEMQLRGGTSPGKEATWVPQAQEVTVAGFRIPGGMVYVGDSLPIPDYEYEQDPALIDPTLRVAKRNPDWRGELMHYWPSYSEIEPESRAAYLHWLADGRREPSAYIGYVFLFFYGLERRVLRDAAAGHASQQESHEILAEVERLLSIYGDNGSFRGYAGNFAELLRLWIAPAQAIDRPPPLDDRTWELPLSLKLGLGAIVRDGKPIPTEWARAWITQHPNTYLRTPAQRCSAEFKRLFDLTYRERFGDGLKIRPPKRKITAAYHPASSAFRGSQPKLETDVPDVSALRKPVEQLRELVDECTDALDSYSRWLGRNPGQERELDALSLLPRQLLRESNDEQIDALARRLEIALAGAEYGVTTVSTLFEAWPTHREGAMLKRQAVQRIRILSALGFGIEPDIRFGGPALSEGGKAVVFPLGEGASEAPSAEYTGAALLIHLAAVVAASDGDVSTEEEEQLEQHLEAALDLPASERVRLRAYMHWSIADPPGLKGLRKRIGTLDDEQRALVGGFLVAVACADGRIDPEEVKLLTKVYRLLDLDPAQVHREIHQVTTGRRHTASEPVTVRRATGRPRGFAIPEPLDAEAASDPGVELDMELVRARMAETAAVSTLLGSIFAEQEPAVAPPPPDLAEASGALDAPHAGLLRALASEPSWPRAAFDELAQRFGLLPDGALDVLNEAALDVVDELVCDGEDPIEVDSTIAEAVLT